MVPRVSAIKGVDCNAFSVILLLMRRNILILFTGNLALVRELLNQGKLTKMQLVRSPK